MNKIKNILRRINSYLKANGLVATLKKCAKKVIYKILKKEENTFEADYYNWIKKHEPQKSDLELQRNYKFNIFPKISIIVPMYNTKEEFFRDLVNCLKNQTYSNWELCLADGSPKENYELKKYLENDSRIKYKFLGENFGISGNTNEALKLATGDYIGLLDHDDLLPVFSLFEVVKAINENLDADFLYSDEDKLEESNGPRYGVFFKPDFSPYTLNSANYICHFSIFKKELMDKLVGFRSEYDGSQDFDIVARASELTKNIVHIPKVLYHWRAHRESTAQNSDSKPYAFEVGKKVIKDHIKRSLETDVEVTDGLTPGCYEVKYKVKGNPKVSIIVDGRNIENINEYLNMLKKSSYQNYEIILISNEVIENTINVKPTANVWIDYNNAVKVSNGLYFIITDENLIKIDEESSIEDLLGICQDQNVGIVGTKLYNKNNLVEHSGIILGMNGSGDFLYKGVPKNIGTYMQRLLIIHNVSCVYAKYALIDKSVFEKVGMFSSEFRGLEVSIDICLKILNENIQVVLNPIISFQVEKLNDVEKNSDDEIKEKWKKFYENGDRYFSPNLSKTDTGLRISNM